MKLGLLGDLHLRTSTPINRIDDYVTNQFNKLEQAFETFSEEECVFILQPGDWFDNFGKDSYGVTNHAIALLMFYRIPIYLVFGQHDIKFHNKDLTDIPIQTLNETKLVQQLTNNPEIIKLNEKQRLKLYGANWNEPLPKARKVKNIINILVAHTMVIKNKKLWPGQTDYKVARQLPNLGYDLVVTGDNHQAFTWKNQVINCGSLMRMRSDQDKHHPTFAIYDTIEKTLDMHYYDILPSNTVFKLKEVEEKKESEERRDNLAESIVNIDIDQSKLNYRRSVNRIVKRKKKKLSDRTIDIIEESLS